MHSTNTLSTALCSVCVLALNLHRLGRQKTIDEKTYCPCYNSTKRIVGGKGRGFWCGSCLYIRMGENIHEVKHRSDWRCPCCRDICNCSGANCLRARRNLAVTNQLIHEAIKQGFKSVRLACRRAPCGHGSALCCVSHLVPPGACARPHFLIVSKVQF